MCVGSSAAAMHWGDLAGCVAVCVCLKSRHLDRSCAAARCVCSHSQPRSWDRAASAPACLSSLQVLTFRPWQLLPCWQQ